MHSFDRIALAHVVVALLAALAGCSAMTQPEDIALAEEMCGKRGGFTHVARFERGKNIIINCRDGTHIDVRRAS